MMPSVTLIVSILVLTLVRSEVVKRACQDGIPNCKDYTKGICSDVLYTNWVKENCAFFCGQCTSITQGPPIPTPDPSGCSDKIANCVDYGKAACSNSMYTQWVTENCPRYCQICTHGGPVTTTTTARPTTPPPPSTGECRDKVHCAGYTKIVCTDHQYDQWANENCPVYCDRCGTTTLPPVTALSSCHDAIPNCADYGTNICTDQLYEKWVRENCQQHCNKCTGDSNVCQDNVQNCAALQLCNDADASVFVHQNCRKTCGLCIENPGTNTCVDQLNNCADYEHSVCSDTNYYQWVLGNCPKTCNMCGALSTRTPVTTFMQSSGCVYKQQVHQEGETWDDGCDYICTCKNGATGAYSCELMCLTWNLPAACSLDPPPPGKCCQVPNCPPSLPIHFPNGYVQH
ncbi:hypothetical protein ACF0H5_005860 [Mactra antiquata]